MKTRTGYTSLTALVIFCFASTASFAQAFGITAGTSMGQLKVVDQHTTYSFIIEPPIKYPAFEEYMVWSTPATGVCRIAALGKTIRDDAYGSRTRNEFANISAQLTSRYGDSKLFDFLVQGSIWHESREWTMAVSKNERTLSRFWDNEEHSMLPKGIRRIGLVVKGLSSGNAYVTVTYEFDNFARCSSLMNANNASKL